MAALPTWISPGKAADMVFDVRADGVNALGFALLRRKRKEVVNTATGLTFAKLNPIAPKPDSPLTRCGWPTTPRDHRLVLAPGTSDPTSIGQLVGDYDAATADHQRLLAAVLTVPFERDRPLHDSFDQLVGFASAYVARSLRLTSLAVLHAPGDQLADEQPHGHLLMLARTHTAAGWGPLAGFFGDNGITGATMERPGLRDLLQAITRADIGVLIIEAVDRLSRDAEHLHYMVKLLRLNRVTVHTVAAGQIDDLVLALKTIIGEQQRARIAYTTRRGLKAKAKRGGATGGKTLGYVREITDDDASGVPTDRLATQPEAALVRRIFTLYAEGASLKRICRILNDEGVPSPRARENGKYNAGIWNPSTLSGDPALGEGILNKEIYVGRRIFNRRAWVEVPNERRGFRRQPRVNPQGEWVLRDEPELCIV